MKRGRDDEEEEKGLPHKHAHVVASPPSEPPSNPLPALLPELVALILSCPSRRWLRIKWMLLTKGADAYARYLQEKHKLKPIPDEDPASKARLARPSAHHGAMTQYYVAGYHGKWRYEQTYKEKWFFKSDVSSVSVTFDRPRVLALLYGAARFGRLETVMAIINHVQIPAVYLDAVLIAAAKGGQNDIFKFLHDMRVKSFGPQPGGPSFLYSSFTLALCQRASVALCKRLPLSTWVDRSNSQFHNALLRRGDAAVLDQWAWLFDGAWTINVADLGKDRATLTVAFDWLQRRGRLTAKMINKCLKARPTSTATVGLHRGESVVINVLLEHDPPFWGIVPSSERALTCLFVRYGPYLPDRVITYLKEHAGELLNTLFFHGSLLVDVADSYRYFELPLLPFFKRLRETHGILFPPFRLPSDFCDKTGPHLDLAIWLVEHGCKVGPDCMYVALSSGNRRLVELVVDRHRGHADPWCGGAVDMACKSGDPGFVRWLLDMGCPLHNPDYRPEYDVNLIPDPVHQYEPLDNYW